MDEFMKMMMLSGNLNHITEPDLFSDKTTVVPTTYPTNFSIDDSHGNYNGPAKENPFLRWYTTAAKPTNISYEREFDIIRGIVDEEEKIAKSYGMDYTYGVQVDTPLKDMMKTDLISFYIYLAVSDGHITAKEATLIANIMGQVSAEEIAEVADEVYEHESRVDMPLSLKFLTLMEKRLGTIGLGTHAQICVRFIDAFEGLGKALIMSDGKVSDIEMKNLNQYIRKMRQGTSVILRNQD